MATISFNPNDPNDFARAFAEFASVVDGELEHLRQEIAVLSVLIRQQADAEDVAALRNVPMEGSRSKALSIIASELQGRLAALGGKSHALDWILRADEPILPAGPRLTVVGGTDTEPAGSPG